MKKQLFTLISSILLQNFGFAQSPVWSTDIAPILYTNCTTCHRPGGLGPFSLLTYSDAYSEQLSVITEVSNGEMPPWPPDKNYCHYRGERFLTTAQVNLINDWVNAGAPSGDTTAAPTPPVYLNGSSLGAIDATLHCPTFTVPTTNGDLYQCFVVPSGLTQDEFLTAIEIIPGNTSIVHHVLVYEDTTSNHEGEQLDAQTPEPGYPHFGGPGVNSANLVAGWVPGTTPMIYPSGMGVPLHKGSDLIVQIHYPYGSAGKTDSTKINIRLSTGSLRVITIAPALNYFSSITEPLVIPADSVKTFEERYTIPNSYPIQGVSLLSVAPHAHLTCTNWLVFAQTPSGDTIPLIKIDHWDFHWQGFYTFQKLLYIPKGSTLFAFATYDNTANNPNNPNSPPQTIHAGDATTDEMMLVYFSYLIYQPGDENIVLDSTILNQPSAIIDPTEASKWITTPQLYNPIPNPANNGTELKYFLPTANRAELRIFDLTGKLVQTISAPHSVGLHTVQIQTSNLASGEYLISLSTDKAVKSKRLIVGNH